MSKFEAEKARLAINQLIHDSGRDRADPVVKQAENANEVLAWVAENRNVIKEVVRLKKHRPDIAGVLLAFDNATIEGLR